MFPSADVIATAIYAAARELAPINQLKEYALLSAMGKRDAGAHAGAFPLARTRTYAGLALWEVFPEANRVAIGRCVGQGYADAWAANIDKNRRAGKLTWFDDDIHDRVRDAIVWAIERPTEPIDIPAFIMTKENPAPMV